MKENKITLAKVLQHCQKESEFYYKNIATKEGYISDGYAYNNNNLVNNRITKEEYIEREKDLARQTEEFEFNKIYKKFLHEKSCALFLAYCLQELKEVINKYDGKKAGEKTIEKIQDELRNKHIYVYFKKNWYTTDIHFSLLEEIPDKESRKKDHLFTSYKFMYDDKIIAYGAYNEQNIIDENNVIHADFKYNTYFPNRKDPKAAAKRYLKYKKMFQKKEKEMNDLIELFNNCIPTNMEKVNKIYTRL